MTTLPTRSTLHLEKRKDPHRFLGPREIEMLDEALHSVGEFGEVRLVIEKGRLRFIILQKSFDTLKWQPGNMAEAARMKDGR